jgi:hypothetical protein
MDLSAAIGAGGGAGVAQYSMLNAAI